MNVTAQTIALIAALSALAGAAVASVAAVITTLITNRSAERRHYRELVMNAAVENWKQYVILTPAGHSVDPLDDFILHMMKFYDLILSKKLKPEDLEARLQEITDQSRQLYDFRTG